MAGSSDPHGHDDIAVLEVVAPSAGRIWPADCASLNSSRTSPAPTAFRKSIKYCGVEADGQRDRRCMPSRSSLPTRPFRWRTTEIFSSPFSRRRRTARERSSANCATRWIAELSSSPCTTTILVLSLRQHGFEVGELSGQLARGQQALVRCGRRAWSRLWRTRCVSASVESSSDCNSSIAFFGIKRLQFSRDAFEFLAGAFSMCARRCPSVATMVIDSGFSTISAPFSV